MVEVFPAIYDFATSQYFKPADIPDQAETKTGEEADWLLAEAEEKLLRAEEISPESGVYNLACTHALRDEETECRKWLEKNRDLGTLPPRGREHLENNADLDSAREQEWFKAFFDSLWDAKD